MRVRTLGRRERGERGEGGGRREKRGRGRREEQGILKSLSDALEG